MSIEPIIIQITEKNNKLRKAYLLYRLNKCWPQIVNHEIAKKTCIDNIVHKKLIILTTSPIWSQQLVLYKKQIINKINKQIGEEIVYDLSFKTVGARQIYNMQIENLDEGESEKIAELALKIEKNRDLRDNFSILDNDWQERLLRIYTKDSTLQNKRELRGAKKCKVCGILSITKNKICIRCINKIEDRIINNIGMALKEAPWTKYAIIKKAYPDCDERIYRRTKQSILLNLNNTIKRVYIEWITSKKKEILKQLMNVINNYVMLQTELEPQKITKALIKAKISKRVYQAIYEGE